MRSWPRGPVLSSRRHAMSQFWGNDAGHPSRVNNIHAAMGRPRGVSWPAGMIKGMTLVKINAITVPADSGDERGFVPAVAELAALRARAPVGQRAGGRGRAEAGRRAQRAVVLRDRRRLSEILTNGAAWGPRGGLGAG